MKFTLVRSTALPVFSQALKTCNAKAKDADSLFFIKENNGSLTITSLNDIAEQMITLPTDNLEADGGEQFAISGQAIVEFLKQFPDEEAVCVWDKSTKILTVTSTVRKIKFDFPTNLLSDGSDDGEDTVEFVPFMFVSASQPITCDAQALANALKLTSFSASTDSTMAPLTAVAVSVDGGKLVAKSSDNFRISVCENELDDDSIETISFLLPHETSDILGDLLSNVDQIKIEQGKRNIRFYWGDTVFTSRIEGQKYPDVIQYMEGDVQASVEISKGELLRALKLAGLVARDSYVILKISDAGLEISTDDQDRGTSSNVIVAQNITGKDETCVAYKFFLKAVETIDAPWVVIEFREMSFADVSGIALTEKSNKYRHFIFPAAPKDSGDSGDND